MPNARRAGVRSADVVRRPVVLMARCASVIRRRVVQNVRRAKRDRVQRVIPGNARYAGVIACSACFCRTPVVPCGSVPR